VPTPTHQLQAPRRPLWQVHREEYEEMWLSFCCCCCFVVFVCLFFFFFCMVSIL
jgi:hypothetical protein